MDQRTAQVNDRLLQTTTWCKTITWTNPITLDLQYPTMHSWDRNITRYRCQAVLAHQLPGMRDQATSQRAAECIHKQPNYKTMSVMRT